MVGLTGGAGEGVLVLRYADGIVLVGYLAVAEQGQAVLATLATQSCQEEEPIVGKKP